MIVYEREGPWSGYTIETTRRGWFLKIWSSVQGSLTDIAITTPYSKDFPKGVDLYQDWNKHTEYGQALAHFMKVYGRVLRKGRKVR